MSKQGKQAGPVRSRNGWTMQVFDSFAAADEADRARQWAKTPAARLREVERLRRINYGYGKGRPLPRFQRVLEVFELRQR